MKKTSRPVKAIPGTRLAPRLKKNDTIGLVLPAGPLDSEEKFQAGIRLLAEMGFKVRFSRDNWQQHGYLGAADRERAREFNELWADPEVKALLAVRGGYGCLRMVEALDLEMIAGLPKALVGFSDISVLLLAIMKKTGLVTFHGPVLNSLAGSDRASIQAFQQMLTGRPAEGIRPDRLEILIPGQARGRLVGGNLTNLLHLLATPYEPDLKRTILFIEDINEAPYRVDRMLTHLQMAGRLRGLAGLILGEFSFAAAPGNGDGIELIWQRVLELFADAGIPVWADFPIGHGVRNRMLPLGIEAEMDSATGYLKFLGPCLARD